MFMKINIRQLAPIVLVTLSLLSGPDTGEAQLVQGKSSANAGAAENARRQQMLKDRQAERAAKMAFTVSNPKEIATEATPEDLYSGADKAALRQLIASAWKEAYPKDEVMGIRFVAKEWQANKNVHRNAAGKVLYVNDKAVLLVSVVVKTSPEIATIFPAYINKDNQTGALNAGVHTKTSAHVIRQMKVANYHE